jgi:hypothetical protein
MLFLKKRILFIYIISPLTLTFFLDDFSSFLGTVTCDCNGGTNCFQQQDPTLKRFTACANLMTEATVWIIARDNQ